MAANKPLLLTSSLRGVRVEWPCRFDGKEALQWLSTIEKFFSYYEITDSYRLRMAAILFDGPVVPWFQELQQSNTPLSWSGLAKAIESTYGPPDFDCPCIGARAIVCNFDESQIPEDAPNVYEEMPEQSHGTAKRDQLVLVSPLKVEVLHAMSPSDADQPPTGKESKFQLEEVALRMFDELPKRNIQVVLVKNYDPTDPILVDNVVAGDCLPWAAEIFDKSWHHSLVVGVVAEFATVRHQIEVLEDRIAKMVQPVHVIQVMVAGHLNELEPAGSTWKHIVLNNNSETVADLSISQWMMNRLVSTSKDGTVRKWADHGLRPVVTLRPYDDQIINWVVFQPASLRPNHIALITAGPLNQEVQIGASPDGEGWLLSSDSDSESWHCIQTLELRSSSELRVEEVFFNQVVVLPHSSLLFLANAKKNAIYAVYVDYGPSSAATQMDYIADFTVATSIWSLTTTRDFFSDVEQMVLVYCVQTQDIHRYALDLSWCLPPTVETMGLGKDPSLPHVSNMPISAGFIGVDPSLINDLFQEASEKTPCTVFVDEIDAFGKQSRTRVGRSFRMLLELLRQELSQALFQQDAACHVIARLLKVRDEARMMLIPTENQILVTTSTAYSVSATDDNSRMSMQTSHPGGSLHMKISFACIWTNPREELLDGSMFPFGGLSSRQDTKVLHCLFVQVFHLIIPADGGNQNNSGPDIPCYVEGFSLVKSLGTDLATEGFIWMEKLYQLIIFWVKTCTDVIVLLKEEVRCLINQECSYRHILVMFFRLLTQHGLHVSRDVFSHFKHEKGSFRVSLEKDVKEILSLYEASFLGFAGEETLEEAREFTTKHLCELTPYMHPYLMHPHLKVKVESSLELLLHWRTPRLEASWYFAQYTTSENMKPCLLQLAKFDFTLVLITHQEELRRMLEWWKPLGLGGRTNFTRDRFLECYFCAAGIVFLPDYGFGREELTKAGAIITPLDDGYIVSGSLHELQFFTKAVARGECQGSKELPENRKLCYNSLYNTADDLANKILILEGVFHGMLERNVISWKVILAGYVQNVAWMGSLTSIDYWLAYAISAGNAVSVSHSLLIELYAGIPAIVLDLVVILSFLVGYLGPTIAPLLHECFPSTMTLRTRSSLMGGVM